MEKRIWIALVITCLFFGCGTDIDSDQSNAEKDRIDKVANSASTFGYDGETIENDLRDAENRAKEQEKTVEEIFNE